jgi:uncharacterized protein YprB with RNaseH-like and TPR domain
MDNDPLLERLRALGMKADQVKPKPEPRKAIDKIIDGTIVKTIFGEAFFVESLHPIDEKYGDVQFNSSIDTDLLAAWSNIPELNASQLAHICFLDTETTSLAGGVGTFAFMVGVGCLNADGFYLRQYFLRDPSEEQAMLASLSEFMTPFSYVCSFNGKSFDLPLLAGRYTLNSITNPFVGLPHLDLLHLARKIWRFRLPSRALKDLEVELLHVTRGDIEIPGWLVPQIYFDYLRTGETGSINGVFYHNRLDVVSLGALLFYSAHLLTYPMQASQESLDTMAIARLYESLGRLSEAQHLYDHCLEMGLPVDYYIDTCMRFAGIYKKACDYVNAVTLWQKAAELGSFSAHLELSKFFEHIEKSPNIALEWIHRAAALAITSTHQTEVAIREKRLLEKIARNCL